MLALVLTLVACSETPSGPATTSTIAPASTLQTFEAPELGFEIDHPADWTPVLKVDEGILEVIAPEAQSGFVPNFNVVTGQIPVEIPRTAYYEGEIGRLEETLPDVQVLEVADVEVDGVPARGITFTSTENDTTIGISRLLVLDDEGQAWEISFFAEAGTLEDLAPMVTDIFQSFTFVG